MSRRAAGLAALVVSLACAAPAAAAPRLITIDTPTRNLDPRTVNWNGQPKPRTPRANVLLPDGYDGRRRFPLLLLLHGAGGRWDDWVKPRNGDLLNTARGLPAIVVMPDAATGFYTDWWNGGRRGGPAWERYFLDDLLPLVERRFRVLPARADHAVAGLSMGGFGSTLIASRLPGYFGTAVTMSGFNSIQRPELELGFKAVARVDYNAIFGPRLGFYAAGHNPVDLAANLAHTRVMVFTGNGVPRPGVPGSLSTLISGIAEFDLRVQNDDFTRALRAAGVQYSYTVSLGVHDWPYWRADFRAAIARGLFRPVAEDPGSWTYRTVAQHGEMWGLRFAFAAPPAAVEQFTRAGGRLRGAGEGTVTIEDGGGCSLTLRLPFDRALATRPCRRLRLSVTPRRLRAGARTRLRMRATAVVDGRRTAVAGARVRAGRAAVRTDGHGRATLVLRPRAGRLRLTVTRAGYLPGRLTVRVLRSR